MGGTVKLIARKQNVRALFAPAASPDLRAKSPDFAVSTDNVCIHIFHLTVGGGTVLPLYFENHIYKEKPSENLKHTLPDQPQRLADLAKAASQN
jgi:hypothetical protein